MDKHEAQEETTIEKLPQLSSGGKYAELFAATPQPDDSPDAAQAHCPATRRIFAWLSDRFHRSFHR